MHHSLLAVSLLAACTDTSSDADLACESVAAISADHMDGFVLEESGGAPIADALIESLAADGSVISAVGTDADGAYRMAGAPGAYRHAIAGGHLDAFLAEPIGIAEALPLPMLSVEAASRFSSEPTTLLLVLPRDCGGKPIVGAHVRVAGAREVIYLASDTKFDRALDATSADSAAMVIGAPAGDASVIVEIDGVELHQNITARIGALVTTWVAP